MFPLYKCEQTYFLPTVYVCAERTFYYFIFKGNSWQPSRWGGVVFKMKNVNEKKRRVHAPCVLFPLIEIEKKRFIDVHEEENRKSTSVQEMIGKINFF